MELKHFAGQSRSVDALFKGIESGRIVHAVIFEGDEDSGKEMLARAYSGALLCCGDMQAPCNACKSCRLFVSGNHPDYTVISAGKSSSVGVEDVALLARQASILPNEGGRKVFVIEDAHLLTAPAQNKLLKLLEEPPLYLVIMLLCGNISSILPTVLSRCIRIRMPRLSRDAIAQILAGQGFDSGEAKIAAASSNGLLGLALKSAGSKERDQSPYDVFFHIGMPGGRIEACGYLLSNRQHARRILNLWQNILRDCLAMKQGNYDIISCTDETGRIERYIRELGADSIISKLDVLCQAEVRLLSNCQYAVLVDWLMAMI